MCYLLLKYPTLHFLRYASKLIYLPFHTSTLLSVINNFKKTPV